MARREVIFSPEAEKAIKKLSEQEQQKIWNSLQKFAAGNECVSIEKIKANPSFYRIRAADFRIIYYPLTNERVVLLLIGRRGEIYRKIPRLDKKLSSALQRLGYG